MTCDNCVHIRKSKSIDEDLNVTEYWFCHKKPQNIYMRIEYSETFRLKNRNSPLSVIDFDNRNKPCKNHEVASVPLDTFMSKDDQNNNKTETIGKLPEHLSFLERD